TANVPTMALNRARILGSISVPTSAAQPVAPGTEYFDFIFRINNTKTAGLGACAGCQDPVCLVLNEVLLTSNNSGDLKMTSPASSNYATWQGGFPGDPNCLVTPTTNKTWGQLKSIYR